MLGKLYSNQDCSAARTLELVGERWSLLILRDALFRGYTRFSEFERSLGIAPNILTKRLEAFVAADIMRLEPGGSRAEPSRYALTERGEAFRPVLMALTDWGDRWVAPGPIEYTDASRSEAVALKVVRKSDGTEVAANEVQVRRRGD